MALSITELSQKHAGELALAIERARAQWVPALHAPEEILAALERVLLFLKQNGSPAPQSRQVASLAFLLGEQLVQGAGWSWRSVSDDGSVNPSVVSPDSRWAVLVVDVVTLLVMGHAKANLRELARACREARAHELLTELAP
jgi:hypothetical protein